MKPGSESVGLVVLKHYEAFACGNCHEASIVASDDSLCGPMVTPSVVRSHGIRVGIRLVERERQE